MNLSALNTGLPQAPMSSATEVNTSLAIQQRPPSGTLSGEDFAAFLRNQIQALKNKERQEIATAAPPPENNRDHWTANKPQRDSTDSAEHEHTKPVKSKESIHQDVKRPEQNKSAHVETKSKLEQAAKPVHTEDTPEALKPESLDADPADKTSKGPATPEVASVQSAETADKPVLSDSNTAASPLSDSALNPSAAQLTTIPLSPSINIITSAQSKPDDKSVADFALAMGLEPSQVKALFGPNTPIASQPNNVSTQQMLAMNNLPSFNGPVLTKENGAVNLVTDNLNLSTAVSTADFQALKANATSDPDTSVNASVNALNNLNIQLATAQLTQAAAPAMPVSTLAVLSMMDTELRAEDIDALKNEFDAMSPTDAGGLGMADHASGANSTHAALPPKAATVLANNPNMAQTFDKLSEKLATELASRMTDKLNAGEWKMKFALKPASLGLVDVQLEMRDGRLSAQFNADTSLTQDLIQNGSQRLKEALGQLGMNNASVTVGQGQTQQQSQSGQSSQQRLGSQRDDNRVKLADDVAPEMTTTVRPRHSNSLQFDNYA